MTVFYNPAVADAAAAAACLLLAASLALTLTLSPTYESLSSFGFQFSYISSSFNFCYCYCCCCLLLLLFCRSSCCSSLYCLQGSLNQLAQVKAKIHCCFPFLCFYVSACLLLYSLFLFVFVFSHNSFVLFISLPFSYLSTFLLIFLLLSISFFLLFLQISLSFLSANISVFLVTMCFCYSFCISHDIATNFSVFLIVLLFLSFLYLSIFFHPIFVLSFSFFKQRCSDSFTKYEFVSYVNRKPTPSHLYSFTFSHLLPSIYLLYLC